MSVRVVKAVADSRVVQEMVNLLEEFVGSERRLLIIAADITGDALDALVMNKEKGALKVS
jgi:chaperonin GroEL (HSP60 family)